MTLAKLAFQLNLSSLRGRGLPPLVLLSDPLRLPDPAPAARRLPRGSAVILRDYGARGRDERAARLARLCRARGLVLLVAGDGRLAARVGAQGVHFPEALAGRARAWRRRRPGWLITVAAHSRMALVRAARAGADAALLSPVFTTPSRPSARPLGALRFAALARLSPLPVYALGGLDAALARRLKGSGAAGLAAIGALAVPPTGPGDGDDAAPAPGG